MRNLQRCQVCSHCRRFRRATAPAPSEFRDIAEDLRPRLEERATTPNWPMKRDLFCWALTKGHSGQSSLLTQRQHLLSLGLGFLGRIQQVGNIGPSAHLQPVGDPLQTHSRLLAKRSEEHTSE